MNEVEEALARYVYASIQEFANSTERSQQQRDFRIGISNIGHCSSFLKYLIQEKAPDERAGDFSAAFVGTAVGDYVERAMLAKWPGAVAQAEITVILQGDLREYRILGHPDFVTPNAVLDIKTVDGFERIKRKGPSQQQLYQRHLYALGCHQAGMFSVPLEEVRTGNVWVDRSANERGCFVHMDTFNPAIVAEATSWLDDVTYAAMHDVEARKEPSREFCQDWCGFFQSCRARDTDVSGLITDPDALASIEIWHEAQAMEKEVKRLKREAQHGLTGVNGSTGKHAVRWVHVNGGHVEYDRAGYDRLSVTKLAPPK